MIKIKSEREIALLKEAGRIVALCHAEMKKCVKPGVSTYELDQICERIILENGATPSKDITASLQLFALRLMKW